MSASPKHIGRFEVQEGFGATNTGTVYRVKDPENGRTHMVKVLDPELIERAGGIDTIRPDLEAIQSLRHPNVGRILETHIDSAPVFIVSEYINGVPLRSLLERRRLSFAEGFRIFRDVCEGLAAAHAQGLVHRDLNPKNVIVSHDLATVKITDFGLGPLKDFAHEVSHGDTGEVDVRTLKYLAPEFLRDSTGDERSDIYSAGVLCYEALTGRTPAGRFSMPSQLNSDAPSELDPLVLRCLSTDRGGRYTSADDLIQDIRELEDRLRLGLGENLKGFAGLGGSGRRPIVFFGLLLILIGVVFFVGLSRKRDAAARAPGVEQTAVQKAEDQVPESQEAARQAEQSVSDQQGSANSTTGDTVSPSTADADTPQL